MTIANVINKQVIWYLCILLNTDHVTDEDKLYMFSNNPIQGN